jgi:hypothetical protein
MPDEIIAKVTEWGKKSMKEQYLLERHFDSFRRKDGTCNILGYCRNMLGKQRYFIRLHHGKKMFTNLAFSRQPDRLFQKLVKCTGHNREGFSMNDAFKLAPKKQPTLILQALPRFHDEPALA